MMAVACGWSPRCRECRTGSAAGRLGRRHTRAGCDARLPRVSTAPGPALRGRRRLGQQAACLYQSGRSGTSNGPALPRMNAPAVPGEPPAAQTSGHGHGGTPWLRAGRPARARIPIAGRLPRRSPGRRAISASAAASSGPARAWTPTAPWPCHGRAGPEHAVRRRGSRPTAAVRPKFPQADWPTRLTRW